MERIEEEASTSCQNEVLGEPEEESPVLPVEHHQSDILQTSNKATQKGIRWPICRSKGTYIHRHLQYFVFALEGGAEFCTLFFFSQASQHCFYG